MRGGKKSSCRHDNNNMVTLREIVMNLNMDKSRSAVNGGGYEATKLCISLHLLCPCLALVMSELLSTLPSPFPTTVTEGTTPFHLYPYASSECTEIQTKLTEYGQRAELSVCIFNVEHNYTFTEFYCKTLKTDKGPLREDKNKMFFV